MRFPVDQPYNITTHFNPVSHPGIDIAPIPAGSTGVQCYAPENCTVYTSGNNPALEGQYLILKGDSGVYYYFGHFAQRLVDRYQRVNEGQVIGILGMTGAADGIHTHHEVRPLGPKPEHQVDPVEYYKSEEEPVDIFNDGDRTTWLAEAYVTDVGQYADLVGKATYKEALEKMRSDNTFRTNSGDVINGFNIFGAKPSDTDLAVWTAQPFKKFQYEKIADGVAKMPPQGVKPYDGSQLYVKK